MRWRRLCEIFFFVFFLSNADALHADINRLHQECFYLIAIRAQEADQDKSDRDGGNQKRPLVESKESEQCSFVNLFFIAVTVHYKTLLSGVRLLC